MEDFSDSSDRFSIQNQRETLNDTDSENEPIDDDEISEDFSEDDEMVDDNSQRFKDSECMPNRSSQTLMQETTDDQSTNVYCVVCFIC